MSGVLPDGRLVDHDTGEIVDVMTRDEALVITAKVKGFVGQTYRLLAEVHRRRGYRALEGHIGMLVNQRVGLNDRLEAERRLLRLMDAHPECGPAGEALSAAGLTLDDVLGEAA